VQNYVNFIPNRKENNTSNYLIWKYIKVALVAYAYQIILFLTILQI